MKFNRIVSFEAPPTSRNTADGTPTGSWTPVAYAPGSPAVAAKWSVEWMPIMPSRSESVREGIQVARDQVRLRMRYRSDVNASQRVRLYGDGETVWQIVAGPAPIAGRQHRMELIVERFSSEGGNG